MKMSLAVLFLATAVLNFDQSTGVTREVVAPLRALHSEEGNIDELINRIKQYREQKHHQEQQEQIRGPPAAAVSRHAERKFAYYPSDPEYYAPRREVKAPPLQHEPGSGQQPDQSAEEKQDHAAPDAVALKLSSAGTSGGSSQQAQPSRGDPERVSSPGVRDKKASHDTQTIGLTADALRAAPTTPDNNMSDIYFIVTVAGVCALAVGITVAGGFCYHRLQKRAKAAAEAEYPAYGVTGPNRDLSPSGDRKLAQSAQMYHYQHQKQQMMAMEKTHNGRHGSASDVDSEEENEEGDYTVYECPGLAPSGEMEVKNPLFQDDPTPAPVVSTEVNGK